ncbi:hypothetical protein JQK19_20850 [Chromobacterium violaceum]|uniref:hypothetical protein n=1 Tax=Chromobacterium violaceum TaxID=536 RepID=UPI001BE7DF40|nr:hypothetical protein [Chromobacterium violaceum]MBT2869683.1 hypothetical protein [Chromobacterium violaceum]
MNNPLNLDIRRLPGRLPAGDVIASAELDDRQRLDDTLAGLRAEAQSLRDAARAELEQARRDGEALRAALRSQGEEECERLRQAARGEAAAEAVEWLCAEQELERRVAEAVSARWRRLTAKALEELLGGIDQNELMLRRVEQRVAEWLPKGALTLLVPVDGLERARQHYVGLPSVRVRAAAELGPGQARLENELLRIHLDGPAHQAWLLRQLAGDTEHIVHA